MNCLKEIERLWVGVNQAMTLLAQDDLLDTEGYRRLQALLKNDCKGGDDDDPTFHLDWLDAGSGSGPC